MRLAARARQEERPGRADWLVAGATTLVAQAEVWLTAAYASQRALFAVAALAMSAPLLVRRLFPIPVLTAVYVPLFVVRLAGESFDAASIMLVLILAVAAVGAHCERRRAALGFALGLVLLAVLLALEHLLATDGRGPAVGDFVFLAVILGGVWALSAGMRERGLQADQHADRADRLERDREERARAAVAEERARIARELHDVVAHSISVIAVQTGATRRKLRHDRPEAAGELTAVERTARQALADMRRMLGLLRAEEDRPGLAPQPGLDQVESLVGQMREAGIEVDLAIEGNRRALPPGLDLAAFRIVQESLTNVLKHAGQAAASVRVRYGEREVALEIVDDGGRSPPAANGGGGGHGLIGMRERVSLYGGTLDAAPHPGGGFSVRATLPTPDA